MESAVALLEVPGPPAYGVRELDRRNVLEVHRHVQAGMAQLLANDVDKDAFHCRLSRTGVAQAMGMDALLTVGFMRESRQERADRAGLQAVSPARPAHATSDTCSLPGQPGAERFLCGALYTVFYCS